MDNATITGANPVYRSANGFARLTTKEANPTQTEISEVQVTEKMMTSMCPVHIL
jgi:hypothetical protein